MDDLIDAIRAASAPDATPEARAAGAAACRSMLAALGEPATPAVPTQPVPSIASTVAMLRGVPPDQLLDLAIDRLRAALPAGVEVPPAPPLKFHLIQLPRIGGSP
jgi:hypothetical protein